MSYDLDKLRKMLKSHSQVYHRNLLQQVAEREKDIDTLKDQYKELQTAYDEKLQSLEYKLRQSKERYKSLEERRKVEIAAFQKDVSFFKNNVRNLEKGIMAKKKEEVSSAGTRRTRAASGSPQQQSKPVLQPNQTEAQRNASIVSHITNFNYNPSELPENEAFYGGLGGQLNTDVHKLKNRVISLVDGEAGPDLLGEGASSSKASPRAQNSGRVDTREAWGH